MLIAYSDASFAPEGGKSHQAVILTLASAPVFWKSHRQSFVALSTAECELIAERDAYATQKVITELINELRGGQEQS